MGRDGKRNKKEVMGAQKACSFATSQSLVVWQPIKSPGEARSDSEGSTFKVHTKTFTRHIETLKTNSFLTRMVMLINSIDVYCFYLLVLRGEDAALAVKKVMVALDRSMGDDDNAGEEKNTQRKAKTTSIR